MASKTGWILYLTAALFGFVLIACQPSAPPQNVLLITIDTLRPDHISCYGYKRNTTPNLDQIAMEGTRYKNVFSQLTSTTPSHSSILTGLTPDIHGVLANGDPLPLKFTTLAEILRNAGFLTGAVVSNWSLKKERGLNQGFDYYDDFMPQEELHRPLYQKNPQQATESALSWLDKNRNKRFFLWVNYMDPHGPYTPPPPYNHSFDAPQQLSVGNLPFSKEDNAPRSIPAYQQLGDANNPDYYVSQYEGEIQYTDFWVGELLKKIKTWGILKNTLIIITSDHGESLGEHDYYFMHSNLTYKEQASLPLIIRYPGLFPEGKVEDARVETIDLLPTILESCKIPFKNKLHGQSLLSLTKQKDDKPIIVFSENAKRISVYQNFWELILLGKQAAELFDLESDPLEKINVLKTADSEIVKRLYSVASKYLEIQNSEKKSDLTEKDKKALRSLGYIN